MMRKMSFVSHPRTRRGFTFLEIILVVAIIGILASIVGPRLVGRSRQARVSATEAQIESLKTALQLFEMEMGEFPNTDDGLNALVKRPSWADEDAWLKQLDSVPKDQWGVEYYYVSPGTRGDYDLSSSGPDRQEGTDDDITSWAKEEDGR